MWRSALQWTPTSNHNSFRLASSECLLQMNVLVLVYCIVFFLLLCFLCFGLLTFLFCCLCLCLIFGLFFSFFFFFSDGRTVAVKHIQKKHFTLTKTIRKEVKEVRWVAVATNLINYINHTKSVNAFIRLEQTFKLRKCFFFFFTHQGAWSPKPLKVHWRLHWSSFREHYHRVLSKGKPGRRAVEQGHPHQLGFSVNMSCGIVRKLFKSSMMELYK